MIFCLPACNNHLYLFFVFECQICWVKNIWLTFLSLSIISVTVNKSDFILSDFISVIRTLTLLASMHKIFFFKQFKIHIKISSFNI